MEVGHQLLSNLEPFSKLKRKGKGKRSDKSEGTNRLQMAHNT
jgi:hypothetical protein